MYITLFSKVTYRPKNQKFQKEKNKSNCFQLFYCKQTCTIVVGGLTECNNTIFHTIISINLPINKLSSPCQLRLILNQPVKYISTSVKKTEYMVFLYIFYYHIYPIHRNLIVKFLPASYRGLVMGMVKRQCSLKKETCSGLQSLHAPYTEFVNC